MKQLLITLLFCLGCSSVPHSRPVEQIATNTASIKESASQIKSEASEVASKVPSPIKEQIKPNLSNIQKHSDKIITEAKDINKSSQELNKQLQQALEERDEAIEHQNSSIQKLLSWLIALSLVGVGVFGVLFFLHGSKAGLTGSAACGAVLLLSIFVKTYLTYLVIAGGVLLALLAGLLVYHVVIKGRAFKEVVASVEKVKEAMPEQREKIKETLSKVQSKVTSNLVHKEKE